MLVPAGESPSSRPVTATSAATLRKPIRPSDLFDSLMEVLRPDLAGMEGDDQPEDSRIEAAIPAEVGCYS